MNIITVEQVTKPVQFAESPHWDADHQCLYFVSVFDNSIHKYDPNTQTETHTELQGTTSFIIPIGEREDEFAVGVDRKVLKIRWDGESDAEIINEIVHVDVDANSNRITTGKADPVGRLYAGTTGKEDPPGDFQYYKGSLYRIDSSGALKRDEIGTVTLSSGMCWDRERNIMYYIDSLENSVRSYEYNTGCGEMTNQKEVFCFSTNKLDGRPAGMTIDTDGNLWIACFDGNKVIKVNPENGKLMRSIPIPALQVTSVTFGGVDLDELYVTTAKMTIRSEQKSPCGAIFKITGLGVKGYAGDKCVSHLG